ncbi:MAG: complex I NDUFA9 subunit family protein [Burkholderiales bacterium]|nr:complex I NDUFA9 subunit family protein [Burkholderiales bacterium]
MKNIMVLGGTGFVGTQVCKQLVASGWSVTVPTRSSAANHAVKALPQVRVMELDVHDASALTQAMAGHSAVVNLVAILHGNADAFDRVHVALPQKVLRACIQNRVPELVHVSALGADAQNPEQCPSEYLRSKSRGEAVLLAAPDAAVMPNVTVLRPSVIFGAQDKFLNLFAKLQKIFPVMPLAGARAQFQPVWVDDAATAVVKIVEHTVPSSPQIIEACGPQVFTLAELVQLSARLSGVRGGLGRPVVALPDWMGRLQAFLMELLPGEPLMSRDNLDSMKADNVASGSVPGLQALGITPAPLEPIAAHYLSPAAGS